MILPSLYFLNVVKCRRSHTRVSKFTFAVFPSTVTLSTEPSFTLTQSSPNMSLKGKASVSADAFIIWEHRFIYFGGIKLKRGRSVEVEYLYL